MITIIHFDIPSSSLVVTSEEVKEKMMMIVSLLLSQLLITIQIVIAYFKKNQFFVLRVLEADLKNSHWIGFRNPSPIFIFQEHILALILVFKLNQP